MTRLRAAAFRQGLALLAAFILLPTPSVAAAEDTPRQVLQEIYRSYAGKGATGVKWRGPEASRYFDSRLTRLILQDLEETDGGVGRMDVDPFVDAQDIRIKAVKIDVVSEDAETAKATVSFVNLSEPTTIAFDLARTPQGWRISNIAWPRWKTDLVSVLSGPLAPE